MIKIKRIIVSSINDNNVDILYSDLLNKKYQFMILYCNKKKYVLTKERSIIEIEDERLFLNSASNDIYYKTNIINDNLKIDKKYLDIYKFYINKFKDKLCLRKYNDKYYFGCVAVKTDNGIITTIRGKEKIDDYTVIKNVDHSEHIINVINKKASLNAPLLDYLFKNSKVKVIVHLHEFDDNLPYYDYAFPGTVRDSIRDNKQSFNISYHGLLYMFDEKGNIL